MKSIQRTLTIVLTLLVLVFSVVGVKPARAAATWTVMSSGDTGGAIGINCPGVTCRLKDAILVSASGDTIVFDNTIAGSTIYLTETLVVDHAVTIDGTSSNITISGDTDNNGSTNVRVFLIYNSLTDFSATLLGLSITKGDIYNYETLNILNSQMINSDEQAIVNEGIMTITNSTVSNTYGITNYGTMSVSSSSISGTTHSTYGGIYNASGTLTITNSQLSGNSGLLGGGINNGYSGNLIVTGSTIINNDGSGIHNNGSANIANSNISTNTNDGGDGGGIYNFNGELTVVNSTFYYNSAWGEGGGIYNGGTVGDGGHVTIINSTFSENDAPLGDGGGINNQSGSVLEIKNTIIANSYGGDCVNNGTINTNINNLIENASCAASLSGDPALAPLADNGGPTQTMALNAGSLAIDAGNDAVCGTSPVSSKDQRDVTRPVGTHCDIGSYEGSLPDTSKPVVSAFTAPATSTSLNIPISTFTATDNVAVTGYKVTTSSTPPTSGATGWSATKPTTYTVAIAGTYTLYPWAKDAAGNVSAVFGTPRTVLVMKERSRNGGFETYTGASKIPTYWSAGTTFASSDGKDTSIHHDGAASVKIIGAAGKTKTLSQTVTLSGNSGDKFIFTFWVKGTSIPTAGLCRGQVMFYNGATLLGSETKTLNCSTATTGFQKKSVTINVGAAYTKIVIRFTYSKASGTVWFDGVSLMK